jgi:hypothetical protein
LNTPLKWDYVVDYAIDMTRNNGKKLFLIINDVLVEKLGVKQIAVHREINIPNEKLNIDDFHLL